MSTNRMSVAEIAEATGASPKTIRAYLRRTHGRALEAKGSRWGEAKSGYALDAKLTKELVERFTPKAEEPEA